MVYLKNVRRNDLILLREIGLRFLTHSPGLYLDKFFLPPAIRSFLHCAFLCCGSVLCGEENVDGERKYFTGSNSATNHLCSVLAGNLFARNLCFNPTHSAIDSTIFFLLFLRLVLF